MCKMHDINKKVSSIAILAQERDPGQVRPETGLPARQGSASMLMYHIKKVQGCPLMPESI